jgi:hypothetical protein
MVEIFFGITRQAIRRATFTSGRDSKTPSATSSTLQRPRQTLHLDQERRHHP